MYDARTSLTHQVADEVKSHFRVFDTVIPRNVRLSEAPSHGLPALLYDAQSKGAQAYLSLAREVVEGEGACTAGREPREAKTEAWIDNKPKRASGAGSTRSSRPRPEAADGRSYGEGAVFTAPSSASRRRRGSRGSTSTSSSSRSSRHRSASTGWSSRSWCGASAATGEPHRDRFEIIAGERRWRAPRSGRDSERGARRRQGRHAEGRRSSSPSSRTSSARTSTRSRSPRPTTALAVEHGYTQEQIATRVGKDRTTIVNALRLFKLPAAGAADGGDERELTEGHARALLGAPDEKVDGRPRREGRARGASRARGRALVREARKRRGEGPGAKGDAPAAKRSEEPGRAGSRGAPGAAARYPRRGA
jgi:hypothetical protein